MENTSSLRLLFGFVCLLLIPLLLKGQNAEPSVNGASFMPPFIDVGDVSTLRFNWSNNSISSVIPPNSIQFVVSPDSNFYQNNGLFSPVLVGFTDISWVHEPSTDTWIGTNTAPIPGFLTLPFSTISIDYKGVNVSSGPANETTIYVQIIANIDTFTNAAGNDTLRPPLFVTPSTDTIRDTVNIGDSDTVCMNTSELIGAVTSSSTCSTSNGVTNGGTVVNDTCLTYEGAAVGIDTLCIQVCDVTMCDTTIVIVTVTPPVDTFRATVSEGGHLTRMSR